MSNFIGELYRGSLSLLTDLYEIAMAYGYWKSGLHERKAVFHATFRKHPFGGGFTDACGLKILIDYLEKFRFAEDDIEYLRSLRSTKGRQLFPDEFLDYLAQMEFVCDIDAVPEGTIVFPHEPLLRITGPLAQSQLLETAVLNLINYQTLIATKAARVVLAANGDPVVEFGLRRSHGIDGGVLASRAAYVGGCVGTSNVLAGKLFGIPVRGTQAHSWVMCFPDEKAAFRAYAEAMPDACILLVDTYDSLQGIRNAIEIGRWLAEQGYRLRGIRLDSGDLAYLSQKGRQLLDEAGLQDAVIVASNDLDEYVISSLKQQGAKINVWGVGTRLATAYDDPALTGVYKLSAIEGADGTWEDRIKVSEQAVKSSVPGILQVRRFYQQGEAIGDAIYDVRHVPERKWTIVDPTDPTRRKEIPGDSQWEDLLVPVLRHGKPVYTPPALEESRQRTLEQLERFHPGVKRFVNPHQYPAGLEKSLAERRLAAILRAKGQNNETR